MLAELVSQRFVNPAPPKAGTVIYEGTYDAHEKRRPAAYMQAHALRYAMTQRHL